MKIRYLHRIIIFSVALLFTAALFVTLISSVVEATIFVEIQETGSVELEESLTLSATCWYADPFPSSCPEDATWQWSVLPPRVQPNDYDLLYPETPTPIFTAHTTGTYRISLTVCFEGDCGSSAHNIRAWDPVYWFSLPYKYPFVVYPSIPSNIECLSDNDGNGLFDLAELIIARHFVPVFHFDSAERWWSLGPEEPQTVFNIAMDGINTDGSINITIRYGMVWAWDAGFVNSDEPWCHFTDPFGLIETQVHAGDTQGLRVKAILRKEDGKANWIAELKSISGFTETGNAEFFVSAPYGPWMTRDGTHPWVYPTAGKHHFRPARGEYEYDISGPGTCFENALGNHPRGPIMPDVEHVPHFPSPSPVSVLGGPQGGPPLLHIDGEGLVWANACRILNGDAALIPAINLRNADIADWTYPACSLLCPMFPLPENLWYNYPQYPIEGYRTITDVKFWSELADGVWYTVAGGFNSDLDGDGSPFWEDPCPVSTEFLDSDSDGLCDQLDICPHDPYDDADNDGICGSPPTCNAGGPYNVACNGTTTFVTLNGLSSVDPDGFPLTYSWSTDCQGDFNNIHSSTPILEVPFPDCSVDCNVFLTVTDEAGASANCSSTVAISDTTPPDISCAANLSLECSDSTLPLHTGFPTVLDMCASSPAISHSDNITSGSCQHAWSINRIWTALDNCDHSNSCEQVINVADTTSPVITCPADITIRCEESADPVNTGSATAADNCDGAPSISFIDSVSNPSCHADNTITRTWTAGDACGNRSTCSQIITIEDTIAPIIACNSPTTIVPPDAPVSFTATATDNCDTEPIVEILTYDCFTYTQKGKLISKLDSCEVLIDNNQITILDSEGIDTTIKWTVQAADCANNQSTTECALLVKNPAK
jgi:hypothetical protein